LEQIFSDGVKYFNKNEPKEKISGYYRIELQIELYLKDGTVSR
jgi:hypothetical protein